MGKSKNPNIDYTYADRFQKFLKKIIDFAKRARSKSEVDNAPDGIFDGDQGELLTKFKHHIFYRNPESNEFVSLSEEFKELLKENEEVLGQGINKVATWTKVSPRGQTAWTLTGYFCPIGTVDCCITGAYGEVSS